MMKKSVWIRKVEREVHLWFSKSSRKIDYGSQAKLLISFDLPNLKMKIIW